LEYIARETGVDFNRFLELVKDQAPDDRMAAILGVSPRTVRSLREHFAEFGLDSVQGQD
jgi:DNA-binding CsgD family transcriptional regulator